MPWVSLCLIGSLAVAGAKFLDASIDPFAGNTNYIVQITDAIEAVRSARRVIRMADSEGKMYECAMPDHEQPGAQHVQPSLEEAQTLLKRLQQTGFCYRRSEGYWAYEVCPGSHVRQYHQVILTLETLRGRNSMT